MIHRPKNKKRKSYPNKFLWVRTHLLRYGVLDAFRAIELYDVTRLAAYIFKLRKRTGHYKWKIRTMEIETRNPSGIIGVHAKYVLISIPKQKGKKQRS